MFIVGFGSTVYRAMILGMTLLLGANIILLKYKKNNTDILANICSSLIIYIIATSIINQGNIPNLISYLLFICPGLLVYLHFTRNMYNEIVVRKYNNLFIGIFIFQIIVSIFKLIFHGRTETIVGTVSYFNGSLNTIFPLVGIAMLISYFAFYKKKFYYIAGILGFIFMAWVGTKRGFYVYLPILIVFGYLLSLNFSKKLNILNIASTGIATLLIISLIVYFAGRAVPQFTVEGVVGGQFSLSKMYNYSLIYSTAVTDTGTAVGRFAGFVAVNGVMFGAPVVEMLFGYGPGEILGVTSFDVEILFMFPWAVIYKDLGFIGLIKMLIFMVILLMGFVYMWSKGDLDWAKMSLKYPRGRYSNLKPGDK